MNDGSVLSYSILRVSQHLNTPIHQSRYGRNRELKIERMGVSELPLEHYGLPPPPIYISKADAVRVWRRENKEGEGGYRVSEANR